MARRPSPRSVLASLDSTESAALLHRLLQRHPELREEAEQLAVERIAQVDPECVAAAVEDAFRALDQEQIWDRSGNTCYGHVDPYEAADLLCEEIIEPFLAELRRLLEQSMEAAALAEVQGILLGLHRLQGKLPADAEEFPGETGVLEVMLAWAKGRSPTSDLALFGWVEEKIPDWQDRIERVMRGFRKNPDPAP